MFVPFEYQEECLRAVQTVREKEDARRALVVMASGLGKTVTVGLDLRSFWEKHSGRALYLCHQNEILEQARTTIEAIHGSGLAYGFFHGHERTLQRTDVLFSSLQTMTRHKHLFRPNEFAYCAVDESHHSHAFTYRSTIEYFEPEFLLGVTATPNRLDELNIRDIYGEEVYSLPLEEALARRLLCPVDYRLMFDEIYIPPDIFGARRPPPIAELNKRMFSPGRDEAIVRTIRRHMGRVENPRVIVFANSIAECDKFAALMPESFAIHSRVPPKERAIRLEMFRQGLVQVVVVVDVMNEGIDVPQANILVFLRATDSQTIFFQQLGRGLRRSKEKKRVLALDFVANCERILMVSELHQRVAEEHEKQLQKRSAGARGEKRSPQDDLDSGAPMTLNTDEPEFREKIIPLLRLLKQVRPNFYPTWQEAGAAAKVLGVTTKEGYARTYARDIRLPSSPRYLYRENFPGWEIFLGRRAVERYPTWEDAARAAKALGIRTPQEYRERYAEDPRLPADPPTYRGCTGWNVFFGRQEKNFYPSWTDISDICRQHGILSVEDYRALCTKDERLPFSPWDVYPDFPGFNKILGLRHVVEDPYPTWQEAGRAAKEIGIASSVQYTRKYKSDPRLYAAPSESYVDFPGWATFLDIPPRKNVTDPYPNWEEASAAARNLGIQSSTEYREKRKADPRLPAVPYRYPEFPGWRIFLGKNG
ncbi:MAG TPA: DEAD/DEAH box helicase family protein [Candidatus Paceibacterota bacterium]|nr:DEAD/DEAH box helicase family protein [Candidatus Paceibacterota bacterium]